MPVTRQAVPAAQPARHVAPSVRPTGQSAVDGSETAPLQRQVAPKVSLASAFDETPVASSVSGYTPPPGKYEAIIVDGKIMDPTDKGQSIKIVVEICDVGDHQGKQPVLYYNIIDQNGKPHQGAGFFKRDMAKLGFADLKGANIEEALTMLSTEKVGLCITAKVNGQYTNCYIDGAVEGSQIIDEWRATRPEQPY